VKSGREGPTIPIQLHGGLRNPSRIVTPAGTTTVVTPYFPRRILFYKFIYLNKYLIVAIHADA
jgi:hypothetical protein